MRAMFSKIAVIILSLTIVFSSFIMNIPIASAEVSDNTIVIYHTLLHLQKGEICIQE